MLEADEILRLEQHTGRSKKVILTGKGREYAERTVAKLYEAEAQAARPSSPAPWERAAKNGQTNIFPCSCTRPLPLAYFLAWLG